MPQFPGHFLDGHSLRVGFQQGDPAALKIVYVTYRDLLSHCCRRWRSGVTCTADVDDLVQDTFSRLFSDRVRRSFDTTRPLLPYLLSILKTVCADAVRADRRKRRLLARTAGEDGQQIGSGDVDHLAVSSVRNFLAIQPCELRALYCERYVRGRSQRKAAAALGLTHQRMRTLERKLLESAAEYLSTTTNTDFSEQRN